MARRVLTQIERRAIWECCGKACVYCGDLVEFSALEVDHILPQSLEGTADAWSAAMQEYSLTSTFDLNGSENLAPSCRRCNGRKSSFLHGRIAIELEIAKRRSRDIVARIDQLVAESKADSARLSFAAAFEAGTISQREINRIVSGGKPVTSSSPEGPLARALIDLRVGDVSMEDVDRILNMAVDLPEHAPEGLALTSPDGHTQALVTTIAQYKEHVRRGYYARTSFDMYIASALFEVPNRVLEIVQGSQFPDKSHIDKPYRGLADLSLLPGGLLCHGLYESEESYQSHVAEMNTASIADMVASGEAVVKGVASELLVLETPSSWILLREILRTDVDRDGVEELVAVRAGGPTDGTFRVANVVVLKRRSHEGRFETS